MNVTVNGERHSFEDEQLTVAALLARLSQVQRSGIAVARNRAVVPKSRWEAELVVDGDEIEIVRATQGG